MISFYYISGGVFLVFIGLLLCYESFQSGRWGVVQKSISRGFSGALVLNLPGFLLKFFCVFLLIFLVNFFGLFSFVFSFSVLPLVTFVLGLGLWVLFLMMNTSANFSGFVSHLVPLGCPLVLISFMVLIEVVSLLIRPLTLSVRLMANITAGHLLIVMVSSVGLASVLLILLELMVSLIQAFVFSLLLSLYFNESN